MNDGQNPDETYPRPIKMPKQEPETELTWVLSPHYEHCPDCEQITRAFVPCDLRRVVAVEQEDGWIEGYGTYPQEQE
jgi:hypothetical protein